MDTSNSKRFIKAFNQLDRAIRNVYNIKRNLGFSEMIRQSSPKNALLNHYRDELFDYAQLRNAIVHNASDEETIAEPHLNVVEKIEYILQQVQTPPRAIDILRQNKVLAVSASDSLQTYLLSCVKNNFTHTPVYDDEKVVGVINAKYVTEALGKEIAQNGKIGESFLVASTVGRVMGQIEPDYIFESKDLTVVEAITHFQLMRSLKAILITANGTNSAPVLRIITASDAVDFQNRYF